MHLIRFIIRIYRDARSRERQKRRIHFRCEICNSVLQCVNDVSYRFCWQPAPKLSAKPLRQIQLLCVVWKTAYEGRRNCPKHVEFYSKNKFEKLVHLIGFIVRRRTQYNRINQLSNTSTWWLDLCCLLHRYQLHVSALMAIFRFIDWQQTTIHKMYAKV